MSISGTGAVNSQSLSVAESLDAHPLQIGESLFILEPRIITILAKIPPQQREQASSDIRSLLAGIVDRCQFGARVDDIAAASARVPAEEVASLLRNAALLAHGLEGETTNARADLVSYLSMIDDKDQRDDTAKFLMQCSADPVSRWATLRTLPDVPAPKRAAIIAFLSEQSENVSRALQGWESLYSLIEVLSCLTPQQLTLDLLNDVMCLQKTSSVRVITNFLLSTKRFRQMNDAQFAEFIQLAACLCRTIPDIDTNKIKEIIYSLSKLRYPHRDYVVSRTLIFCREIADSATRFQFISDFICLMIYLGIPAETAIDQYPKALYWLELLADVPSAERATCLANIKQCLTCNHREDREAFVDYLMEMPKSQVATKVFWETIARPLWDCIIPPYEAQPLEVRKAPHYFFLALQHNLTNDELPAILTALNQVPTGLRADVAGCASVYEPSLQTASASRRAAIIAMIGSFYIKQNSPQEYHLG